MEGQPLSSASPEGRSPEAARSRRPRFLPTFAAILLAGGLAACNTTGNLGVEQPAVVTVAAPPTTVPVLELVGNWGFASYHEEKDRTRTQAEAKSACSNPYKITQGPNGGVMMYLADQNKPSEVFVKQTTDSRDQRQKLLEITPAGMELWQALPDPVELILKTGFDGVPEEDITTTVRVLSEATKRLQTKLA